MRTVRLVLATAVSLSAALLTAAGPSARPAEAGPHVLIAQARPAEAGPHVLIAHARSAEAGPHVLIAQARPAEAGPHVLIAHAQAPAPANRPPAGELAKRLQARYDGIRDFEADFTQSYRGGVLRKTTTERGRVVIKKPGLMRWTYTAPEEKLFVSDGRKMYVYVPEDRQVMVRDMPAADTASTPVLFLVGRGNIARDFRAEHTTVEGAPAATLALKLTPKQPQREYEWLSLVVDEKTLAFRMLVAQDAQGGTSTFTFTNLKENTGVTDKTFSFRIPRGVDIITEG